MLIAAAANNIQQAATPPKTASPIGILQRFEIQLSLVDDNNRDVLQQHDSCCSTSQQLEIIADPSDAENMVRCPCCRASQVKLICVSCLCTNVLRIGKVKEELRRLQQSKTAVSFLIESALLDEIKFESDFHQLRRSIDGLKAKIAWKRDQVGRLRQRIANMNCDSERCHRNLVLLEKKTISHIDRINKTQLKIEDVKTVFCSLASKLSERITLVSRAFFQIFQLEKRQLFTGEHPIAWTGQPKVHRAAYLLNNCLCLDRTRLLDKIFTQQIGAAAVSTSSDASSTELAQQHKQQYHNQTFAQPHQQSPYESMAALAFAGQLAEQLAILLDFHLPYGRHLRKGLPLLFLCCPPAASGGGSLPPPEMALRQALFRLDYAILHLCLGQGVRPEQCAFTEPLANLHELIMLIQAGKMSTCVPRIDQRLHRQICEQFTKMQPDGRVLSEFTLDNVENDWVKVHCSS